MMHSYCAEYKGISIRPIHEEDIERLRKWRNDKELSKYLSPKSEITLTMQKKWFERYISNENLIFFAIVDIEKNKMVGTVALYNFTVNLCEVGKIVIGDLSERGKGIGYYSLLMAMSIGIRELGIETFILKVCEDNIVARNLYKKIGFWETGKHLFYKESIEINMTISKNKFVSKNNQIEKIFFYKETANKKLS